MTATSVLEAATRIADRHGDAIAVRTERRPVTFAALMADAERVAALLGARGVAAGDGVAVGAASPAGLVTLTLAARHLGAAPMPSGPSDAPPPGLAWKIVWPAGAEADELAVARLPEPTPLPEGTAFLRSTSGSTGIPKLVAFSERQSLACADLGARLLDLGPETEIAATVPLTTGYGWLQAGLAPLLAGTTVHHVSALSPRALLAALRAPRVTWGVSTAPVVRALARLSADGEAAVSARLLVGAAPYPAPEAAVVRQRFGLSVLDRYGATEAGPVAQAREPGGPLHGAPGLALSLAGDPPTLRICGDSVALGYVGGAAFGGCFDTADSIEGSTGDGFFVRGRTDRVIRRAGRALDLGSVEDVLLAHPAVAQARVRALPGPLDVVLVADVVLVDGSATTAADLMVHVDARLQAALRPSRIDVVAGGEAGLEKWRTRADALHEPTP